jgi:hypothetical protein
MVQCRQKLSLAHDFPDQTSVGQVVFRQKYIHAWNEVLHAKVANQKYKICNILVYRGDFGKFRANPVVFRRSCRESEREHRPSSDFG